MPVAIAKISAFFVRFWPYVTIIVLLLGIVGGGFWYYKDTQAQIQQLTADNASLKSALAQSQAALDAIQAAYKQQADILQQAYKDLQIARQDDQNLAQELANFEASVLVQTDPSKAQEMANKTIADMDRCFEIVSGSPLTADEKSSHPKSPNTACPSLANPNYHPTK